MDDATHGHAASTPAGAAARPPAKPRRRVSVVGVFGEILITLGVVTLLFVAWQLWIGDIIIADQRAAEATELSDQWQQEFEDTIGAQPAPDPTPDAPIEPPILAQPKDAEKFATMRIPRFGPDYAVTMAGGTSRARTLDPIGIGHYADSKMPGEAGNFAVAAHRTTYGKPFNRIADLRIGDAIVVETPDGWYTYRFRTLEYVRPDAVDVLLPVPQKLDTVNVGTGYLTMTSCSPLYSLAERIVAYSVFESYTPRADGPPASLTDGVDA